MSGHCYSLQELRETLHCTLVHCLHDYEKVDVKLGLVAGCCIAHSLSLSLCLSVSHFARTKGKARLQKKASALDCCNELPVPASLRCPSYVLSFFFLSLLLYLFCFHQQGERERERKCKVSFIARRKGKRAGEGKTFFLSFVF